MTFEEEAGLRAGVATEALSAALEKWTSEHCEPFVDWLVENGCATEAGMFRDAIVSKMLDWVDGVLEPSDPTRLRRTQSKARAKKRRQR